MESDLREDSGPREYDVALSFAGEDRTYVEEVAAGLKHRGIRVFYDRYEEANLWGKDLYQHLAWVYSVAAEYCVLFASEAYYSKVWATHERRNAQERALAEHREYILPARFDDTKIPGIRDTVGYIDLQTHVPDDLVDLIGQKLGPKERRNYFPPDLGRLFEHLGIEDPDLKDWATNHAQSFFSEFIDLDPTERRLVFNIFARGCSGNMPVDMHVSTEKLGRWLTIDPGDVPGKLKRIRPFGFEYRIYRDEEEAADESDYQMVALTWKDLSVYGDEDDSVDEDFVMEVVSAVIHIVAEDFCTQCVNGVIDRCDFSPLEPPIVKH
jgi:TIR domain